MNFDHGEAPEKGEQHTREMKMLAKVSGHMRNSL